MSANVRNPIDTPAFPHDKGPAGAIETGMSLRDYFAAKAMQAWIAAFSSDGSATYSIIQDVANYAYDTADAMLAERMKGGNDNA